jgi:hypothetical protein
MSPYDSDDLTEVIEQRGNSFVVLRSLQTAEHDPAYEDIAEFRTREEAQAYLEAK